MTNGEYKRLCRWFSEHADDIKKLNFMYESSGVYARLKVIEEKMILGDILGTKDEKVIDQYYNGILWLRHDGR